MPPESMFMPEGAQFHNGAIGVSPKAHLNRSSQHINGSIEPIYENVPLPWKNENESIGEIRNRTSSVQSAPGVSRLSQEPQIAVAQQPAFFVPEKHPPPRHSKPTPETSEPAIVHQDHFTIPSNQPPPSQAVQQVTQKPPTPTPPHPEVINRSHSTNVLDSSAYSTFGPDSTNAATHNSTAINAIANNSVSHQNHHSHGASSSSHNDSGISSVATYSSHVTTNNSLTSTSTASASSSVKETKRRKIWAILGGRSKKSSEQQKSATLGREKDRKNKAAAAGAASGSASGGGSANSSLSEGQIKHRWSTGTPRQQPLPANISKEKLCSLLESKLADPQLYCEFERIPKRVENAKYDCALAEENKSRNFDNNFLP